MDQQPSININGVDIDWDTDKGTFNFFGTPSALFWINPSLLTMLQPLAEEVGHNLFRLQVAASASLGTEEDYHNMVTVLGESFEEGFLNWGKAVSAAGWGTFAILDYQPEQKKARVKVSNTWELLMQQDLTRRWGCPFIQGKIIGIFNHALKTNCWADEVVVSYDKEDPFVEFSIYESSRTISKEIQSEQLLRMQEKERLLADEIEKKTHELNEAKIRAEAASYAKSKFLSAMSHELRTPLNAVLGFSKLLATSKNNSFSERQQYGIESIHESGGNMLRLVNSILTFSELGLDSKDVGRKLMDAIAIIDQVVDIISPVANKRSIRIKKRVSERGQYVVANEDYFKEILLSFLSNASNYIQEHGEVELYIINLKNYTRIVVSDDGPGIPQDHQAGLFEAFERASHENGSISGAGVGLAIAKMMVEQMDGRVGFKNNETRGVSFWVDLPLKEK